MTASIPQSGGFGSPPHRRTAPGIRRETPGVCGHSPRGFIVMGRFLSFPLERPVSNRYDSSV